MARDRALPPENEELVTSSDAFVTSSFLLLVVMHLLLVAMRKKNHNSAAAQPFEEPKSPCEISGKGLACDGKRAPSGARPLANIAAGIEEPQTP